jgi:acyl-CoA synthetase (AMP-forming)/AMP-acid ligase II/acyl carrier protein
MKLLTEYLQHQPIANKNKTAYCILNENAEVADSISFEALNTNSKEVAFQFLQLTNSSHAIILLPAGLAFIQSFYACLQAGIVAVPLATSRLNKDDKLIENLKSTYQISTIITNLEIYNRLKNKLSADFNFIIFEQLSGNVEIENVDNFKSNEIAYLQFTSGSTALPKGVVISHQNVINNAQAINLAFERTENDHTLTWLPHYHDMGLVEGIICGMLAGNTTYIMNPIHFIQQPINWIKAISEYKINYTGAPNFAFEWCNRQIKNEAIQTFSLQSIKKIFVGAEPIRLETMQNFIQKFSAINLSNTAITPAYGLAEATLAVTIFNNKIGLTIENEKYISCGKAVHHTEIIIVQPNSIEIVEDGTIGEILVSGSSVAEGYYKLVAENFNCIINNKKYLRTGDLGFLKNEELFITGRIKNLIIINGVNYQAEDIETITSNAHENINGNAVAAFGVDVNNKERLIIYAECRDIKMAELSVIELAIGSMLRKELGIIPHEIIFVKKGSLPKTSSGKIQRLICKDLFLAQQKTNMITQQQIEEFLIQQFSKYLKIEATEIQPSSSFSQLKIDSIVSVTVVSDLQKFINSDLDASLLYEFDTIEEVAKWIIENKING